jgi:hypothetical protein
LKPRIAFKNDLEGEELKGELAAQLS